MRLITFSLRGAGSPRIGVRVARQVLDLAAAAGVAGEPAPPARMKDLLAAGDSAMKRVRKLAAEAHAGSIELASLVGRGSTFTISLPLQVERRLEPTPPPIVKPN